MSKHIKSASRTEEEIVAGIESALMIALFGAKTPIRPTSEQPVVAAAGQGVVAGWNGNKVKQAATNAR